MSDVRSNGDASYLAQVKFDHETDLSFKVGGIVVSIGPAVGKDWDEATPVKAGTVLAELKQADFTNALNSARARAELMVKQLERFRKLRVTDAISQQELDVTEADWRTAQAATGSGGTKSSRFAARRGEGRSGAGALHQLARHRFFRPARPSFCRHEPDVGRVGFAGSVGGTAHSGQGNSGGSFGAGRNAAVSADAFRKSESRRASEGRLFRVVIKVPNPDGLLRSGMTARIRVDDDASAAASARCAFRSRRW